MSHMAKTVKIDVALIQAYVRSSFLAGKEKAEVMQTLEETLGTEYQAQVSIV